MVIYLLFLIPVSSAAVISLYGDVYKDTEFFTRTYPWVVDNIGGDISVNYYLQGSGRYTVPQTCVMNALTNNTYLQAQFLKCEAENRGQDTEFCLCEAGIDRHEFRQCVASHGSLAAEAAAQYQQLGLNVSPIIELRPGSTVFGVEDRWFLKKICRVFGDKAPHGCERPCDCRRNETEAVESRAIAHFDVDCRAKWNKSVYPTPVVTPTTTEESYTTKT